MKRYVLVSAIIAFVLSFSLNSADACMVFRLNAGDGTAITGRTMEFKTDLKFDIIVVPRGTANTSPTPDDKAGLSWEARYGYVGVAQFGMDYGLSEGMNEKGLAVSALWFEPDMKWQEYDAGDPSGALAGPLVTDWLLGNLDSVENIEQELGKVQAFSYTVPDVPGFCPTLHFFACDAQGNCKVIEYENGELNVYDNPLGVMTNAPRFPWHTTNLRQYVGIKNYRPPAQEWSGVKLNSSGHGAGMFGLPGDITPPSRFVRLAVYTHYADQQPDAAKTLNLAQHIVNSFDIFFGLTVDHPTDDTPVFEESTEWASFRDLTNLVFYFRTYDNFNLRKIDLRKLDFSGGEIKRIRMYGDRENIIDVTGSAR